MDYSKDEKEVEKVRNENDKYLELFYSYLVKKNFSTKTINNHISNVSFYLNDFLCYYEVQTMENGCYQIDDFLGDWFIRKAMWSNCASIKSNCASIKKFYECMLEHKLISAKDFQVLKETIKDKKAIWIASVEEYNDVEYDW